MDSKISSSSSSSSSSRTCLCAPTTHPGSFRCSLHRSGRSRPASSYPIRHELKAAKAKAAATGKSVQAVLLNFVSPSNRDLRRRRNFQPAPTRFRRMNNATV
ncbi:hypothetical protein Cni_G24269 [Canna indica]|uniref:Serine-rich protein-like protein n=1 Tax=Canna indica TaxID=4628 RepID=A0AAQ3KYQ9_9LILI|nr:hypothetical protein Cni_G24269 [Canna indica]